MHPIKYPVRVESNVRANAGFVHIKDANDQAIAGGILPEHAEEIVAALNQYRGGKVKRKKEKIEETLRRSDVTAQLAGRDDVEYAPHDSLPSGMHVTNLRKS